MDQEERQREYELLMKNQCFREFREFLDVQAQSFRHAISVDLTNLGNGAILAREKALGMWNAFDGMQEYIKKDLPAETLTLEQLKSKLAEKQKETKQ